MDLDVLCPLPLNRFSAELQSALVVTLDDDWPMKIQSALVVTLSEKMLQPHSLNGYVNYPSVLCLD